MPPTLAPPPLQNQQCNITESDESAASNQFVQNITVIDLTPRPDFTVKNVTFALSAGASPSAYLLSGQAFVVTVTVANSGFLGVPGVVRVWLSSSATRGCGEAGDAQATISTPTFFGLGDGTVSVTISGLTAGNIGMATLQVFVDADVRTAKGGGSDWVL